MIKKIYFFAILQILVLGIFAQSFQRNEAGGPKIGTILGKIKDKNSGAFIEYATVSLYNQKDSSLVTGTISNPDGSFLITEVPYGMFYIEASFVGFEKTRLTKLLVTPQSSSIQVGIIDIIPSTTALKEVEITGQRPQIEYKIDKKVISVDQNVAASGGTAVDVLENTPSVQVDIEGNVSLRGNSNFTVLIDGKPSVLKGSEALQQLPASAIQSIEIITNPSAKYDSEGSAGIFNVIMKKQKQSGINGVINASISSNMSYGGDFLFNIKKNKFNYTIGAEYNKRNFENKGYIYEEKYNQDTTSYKILDSEGAFHRNGIAVKGGIEYAIDDKKTLSISGNIENREFGREADSKSYTYKAPGNLTDIWKSLNNDFNVVRNSYEIKADYIQNFNKEGHQISFSGQYSDEISDEEAGRNEWYTDSLWRRVSLGKYEEKSIEDDREIEFRGKIDYLLPFSDKSKLEAGYQLRHEISYGNYRFDTLSISNEWISIPQLDNDKDFKNIIHAVYSTYSNQVANLFNFQIGLRAEYNQRLLVQNITNQEFKFEKLDLFPSVHLSKKLPKDFQVQASYTRRIDRPGDRELDPYRTYMDSTEARQGNPGLKPRYLNSYELNIQKSIKGMGFISLELFYKNTTNLIDRYVFLEGSTGVTVNSFRNVKNDYSTGAEVMINTPLSKWLIINTSASLFDYRIKDNDVLPKIDTNTFAWNGRMSAVFRFKWGMQAQLTGNYTGPSVTSQGTQEGFFFTNLGVRQDLMNKKLTIALQIRDLFKGSAFERKSRGDNFYSYNKFTRQSQIVTLQLTYKLNNYQKARKENGQNVNETEFEGGGEMF